MKRSIVLTLAFTALGAALLLGNTGDCPAGNCTANCIESCVYGCEGQNCSTASCNVDNCHNNCNFDLANCITSCMENCLGWCQSEACYSICQNCGAQVCSQCTDAHGELAGGCIGFGLPAQERDLIVGEDYKNLKLLVTDYSTANGRNEVETSFSVQMLKNFYDVTLILDFKDSNGTVVGSRTLSSEGSVNFFDGYSYQVNFVLNVPYEENFYYSVRSFRGTPNRS